MKNEISKVTNSKSITAKITNIITKKKGLAITMIMIEIVMKSFATLVMLMQKEVSV